MKNCLFLFLFFSTVSFGQTKKFTAISDVSKTISEQKTKGEFVFIFPADIREDQIKKNAAFYTNSFSVESVNKSGTVLIKMVDNTEKARHIIKRFLISNQINQIKLQETVYSVDEFYEKFIK